MKNRIYRISGRSVLRFFLWLALALLVFIVFFISYGFYIASRPISYIPDIDSIALNKHPSGVNQIKVQNPWFTFLADEKGISVESHEGKSIMSNLTFYSSYDGLFDSWGLKNISVNQGNDSTVTISGEGTPGVIVSQFFTVHQRIPKLDVLIRVNYNTSQTVKREAIVAKFDIPVSEIYLKNGKIESHPFSPEYWLMRQGVRFGSGSRSSLIYNTPDISSMQLDVRRNILFINLDFNLDHPYIHYPFQEDGGGKWENLSSSVYNPGTQRENSFSIYFSDLPKATPRLMMIPSGYIAGYVFTEHADGGNLKTHRAAYFGADSITDIKNATGGFAGHKIPVTKSIFYSDTVSNQPGCSIFNKADQKQYLDFLDQLDSSGLYEICLHTPEDYNSNRDLLFKSIEFMKLRYDSKTWIDHGMYSGKTNREAFVSDGLNPSSVYFAADIWEKFDTRFFWNPAVEEIDKSLISPTQNLKKGKIFKAYTDFWKHYFSPEDLNRMSFFSSSKELIRRYHNIGELNSFLPNKGDEYPTPLFWLHPTRTRDFYSWKTDYIKDYGNLSTGDPEKEIKREHVQLDSLVANWGIFINHGYFVRNREGYNIFKVSNGQILINPNFDKVLEIMSDMREKGDLLITTIRDLLEYSILTEKVSFNYKPNGVIDVYNQNDKTIKGLSIALRCKSVIVTGQTIKSRNVDGDTIIWFDLPGKSKVSLQVEE